MVVQKCFLPTWCGTEFLGETLQCQSTVRGGEFAKKCFLDHCLHLRLKCNNKQRREGVQFIWVTKWVKGWISSLDRICTPEHVCRRFSPVTSCSGSWRSGWSSQSAPLCCWQGAPPHPPPRPRSRQWPSVGGGARSAVQGAPPSHRQLPPSTRPPVHDSPIPENFLPAVVTLRCRTWSQVGEKWALSLRSDVCQAWPCDIIYTNWKLTVLSSESENESPAIRSQDGTLLYDYCHVPSLLVHVYSLVLNSPIRVHTTKNLVKSQLYRGILHESQLIHICLWFYEKGWFFSVAAPHPYTPTHPYIYCWSGAKSWFFDCLLIFFFMIVQP